MPLPVTRSCSVTTLVLTATLLAAATADEPPPSGRSQWVSVDAAGKLAYKRTERGDRVMDFSFAGYMGGGVALPRMPVKQTVEPPAGDATAAIQEALDAVAKLPLADGFRGAVLLNPGTFKCDRTLVINVSGVVLRGSGPGPNGTVIEMTGRPHACIAVRASGSLTEAGGTVAITDAYVPSGTMSFTVADASAFKAGDSIAIKRPVTDAWVAFMGMHDMVRDGRAQTWIRGEIRTERTVRSVEGNRVTIDIPLSDSINAKYLSPPGASIAKCTPPNRITQVGVEELRIVSPPQDVTISDPHHSALRIGNVMDGWVRDVAIDDTVNSVSVGSGARRVTMRNVAIRHSVPTRGAAKPGDFACNGSEVLFDRCFATGNNVFFVVTGAKVTGPSVFLNCTFAGDQAVEPHQRWATGLLLDGCRVTGGGINLMNRGSMGSGHGWTIGWGVAWNCVADRFLVQQPPGTINWAIGCRGERKFRARPFATEPLLPEGTYDSHGTPVAPASLYLAQLKERLGAAAVANVRY